MADRSAAERPLLMIPGPVEVSPAVLAAFSVPPPSHRAPGLIELPRSSPVQLGPTWRVPSRRY